MTYLWVIPTVLVIALLVWIFWAVVKRKGGSGVRREGRTVFDSESDHSDRRS
jgi:cytochrome c-type biogenesis protein CcmH/NrfF